MANEPIANAAQLIDAWAARLGETVAKHGPDAAELALAVGRFGAARELVGGLLELAVAAAVMRWLALPLWLTGARWLEEGADGVEGLPYAGALGAGVVAGIFALIGLGRVTDVYAWAGLWRPELWLAAKALGL